MTREEAIKVIKNFPVESTGERKAVILAIEALEQEQQSEWERDHEILKAYADGQESMKPCKDAISKQSVINILDDMVKDYVKENDFDKVQGVAWVKVQKLPSVNAEKTGRWIPVSERLPENSGRYLAYIVNEHDNKLQYIMTCDYLVDGYWNWFPDDECASDNVIAWMPLPQPYKGESEGKE